MYKEAYMKNSGRCNGMEDIYSKFFSLRLILADQEQITGGN